MASGLGGALRRGRCDTCGRRCVWCGWPRDDSDLLDDDGDVVDARPDGAGEVGEGRGDLGRPSSWSPVGFVGDADGGGLARCDELRAGRPTQGRLQSSWSPFLFDDLGDRDGGGSGRRAELIGGRLSTTRVHPSRSPFRFDDLGDVDGGGNGRRAEVIGARPSPAIHASCSPVRFDNLGDGNGSAKSRCCKVLNGGAEMQDGDGRRRTWWSRFHQRIFTEGVDFVPDSQEGPGDEFVLLTDSSEERDGGLLSPDEDEVVPETEFQEQGADGSLTQACTMDGGVLLSSADGATKGNVTNAACVSSDAETEDENGTEDDVRVNLLVNSKGEDFKTELLRLHLPGHGQEELHRGHPHVVADSDQVGHLDLPLVVDSDQIGHLDLRRVVDDSNLWPCAHA